jgi:8-oxo-dGTP diphosphatase
MSTVIVAAAIVHREGKVLLTKRQRGSHLAGYWEFPGGELERGEAPEAAVVRECEEECGIQIEVDDIFDVVFHQYPEKEVLLLFYRCHLSAESKEVQHLGVDDHLWCSVHELPNHKLPPADIRLVEKLIRNG